MRPLGVTVGKLLIGIVFATSTLALTAAPALASSFTYDSNTHTYTYTGDHFNACGFGCAQHAPANILTDFIIVTLTFNSELLPNLNNASPGAVSWTMHDSLGVISLGGLGNPNGIPADGGDPPTPGLVLSTDANRHLVSWIVSASQGSTNQQGDFVGSMLAVINPPIFCGVQCANGGITDAMVFQEHTDVEFDAFTIVGVPEPGTLTLLGLGLIGVGRRRGRR